MQIRIGNDQLSAVIDSTGSELISLQSREQELLWEAGPEWARHAPILCPVIGRVAEDVIRHNGLRYPVTRHGFVRDSGFTVVRSAPDSTHLRLDHHPEDATGFPFPFALETQWHVAARQLTVTFILTNSGHSPLPASLGWHPAFGWKRDEDLDLVFERPETGSTRRVNSEVHLTHERYDSPLKGNSLRLTEELLSEGALIFESLNSRTVRLVSSDGPVLSMAFRGFPHLAVWKKPGADFVCLEPWSDLPHVEGERRELSSVPAELLMPGASKGYSCRLRVHGK
ncbi:aldose epimerase family protein [Arthrobacter sp. YN]|uniref:aldose epimerase family protein n=1 Tax=Arthrobacter sp. YN TaxID=2020486 RepID=UPI000B5E5836|nr:hypothetical protein [Arthrobacter sp. YN]ASN22053.1 aldose epimerase [Arthrobacter sp. YN]